jgi:DNA-binding NtrC family response regulator
VAGNVRELANVVERAVILCRGDEVLPEDFALTSGGTLLADMAGTRVGNDAREEMTDDAMSTPRSLVEMERQFIHSAWNATTG